ncbi:hypothetical protein [Nitrospirillum bahiense]|uniref:DNA primase/helicase n=1 Tax=Nitrospirillum amazonense TaxID=28077 RepID=A0A560F1W4_9PROT|nr:hypothetical protein [Nitrospirillum amazonense]TWB15610.1 hypothetical protein FBZ88_12963 [Nitrospirillum amazonense]
MIDLPDDFLTPDLARLVVTVASRDVTLVPLATGNAYTMHRAGQPMVSRLVPTSQVDALLDAGMLDRADDDGAIGALAGTEAARAALTEAEAVLAAVAAVPPDRDSRAVVPSVGGTAFEAAVEAAEAYVPPLDGGDDDDGGVELPFRRERLPEDCPVQPLGNRNGVHYYLDAQCQFRELPDEKHGEASIRGLFAPRTRWLYNNYPRKNKDGGVTGWHAKIVAEQLMEANAFKGLWTPRDHVRGAGAWADEDGRLILHLGNLVLRNGETQRPGVIDDMVYPADEPLPGPSDEDWDGGISPAAYLMNLLRKWEFKRKAADLDAMLLLGWLVAAPLGGALRFRPCVWLTGDKGTGKSTLQDLIMEHLMGRWLLRAADATAASLYQTKGQTTLPIALDELEPRPDNPQRNNGIIELAKIAATSGKLRRGGQDGQAAEYPIRSCFMFSSILIPPLTSQDKSRMAVLELDPLRSTDPPKLEPKLMRRLGRALLRLSVERWGAILEAIDIFRAALGRAGHSGRTCDVFGTLLGCVWAVLHDRMPKPMEIAALLDQLTVEALAEQSGDAPDHENCVHHLLTTMADIYRGGTRRTIGEHVYSAAYGGPSDQGFDRLEGQQALGLYGMRVVKDGQDGRLYLAVSNSHTNLAGLFAGTVWAAGHSGGAGVWVQSLRRFEGAQRSQHGIQIGGKVQRCTLLPLEAIVPKEAFFGDGWEAHD